MTNIVNITVEGQSFSLKPVKAIMVTVDRKKYYFDRNTGRFIKPRPDPLIEKRAIEIISNYFPKQEKRS
ncbi:hypothetical protein KTO58_01315 [Chitinophaga pendula]|uniref:hypothetical protein n=1 Tax=Chitinophaga TaxID=79328 RepID=UPI000BB00003|nr:MULTISPECIES: hypothetical protein [Chitinophaga]ASZ14498.1 hypothetical protein CK934_27905 [Chitinophaga sp. MD30]UCJ07845.1 hypothetical protein KTO58_01315 [Chitinophaga pendula]